MCLFRAKGIDLVPLSAANRKSCKVSRLPKASKTGKRNEISPKTVFTSVPLGGENGLRKPDSMCCAIDLCSGGWRHWAPPDPENLVAWVHGCLVMVCRQNSVFREPKLRTEYYGESQCLAPLFLGGTQPTSSLNKTGRGRVRGMGCFH